MLMEFEIVGFNCFLKESNDSLTKLSRFDLIEFKRIILNRIISKRNILAYCLATITWLSIMNGGPST